MPETGVGQDAFPLGVVDLGWETLMLLAA